MDWINDHRALTIGAAIWLGCALLGWAAGSSRRRGASGFVLGAILGPLGILLAMFLPAPQRSYRRR